MVWDSYGSVRPNRNHMSENASPSHCQPPTRDATLPRCHCRYGYDNGKPGITQEHMDEFNRIAVLLKGPITIAAGKKGVCLLA